jgi:hypothetical protein
MGGRSGFISNLKVSSAERLQSYHTPTMHLLRYIPSLLFSCAWTVSAAKNPKRGLAYAEADRPTDIAVSNQSSSVLSWVYDWGTTPRPFIESSTFEYIPMIWGKDGVDTFADKVLAQGSKTILV